jgi:hypothetical protein
MVVICGGRWGKEKENRGKNGEARGAHLEELYRGDDEVG